MEKYNSNDFVEYTEEGFEKAAQSFVSVPEDQRVECLFALVMTLLNA